MPRRQDTILPIVKVQRASSRMQPINITAADLLSLLGSLGAPGVITKNTRPESEQNYRRRPRHAGEMLDGFWPRQPARVTPGVGFALHLVERHNEVWLGDYLGTVGEDGGQFSLVVGDAQRFHVVDLDFRKPGQQRLKEILKQPGAVIYSYVDPAQVDAAADQNTVHATPDGPAFKMTQVKQRLCQRAFRNAVFARHGKRCVVTDCAVEGLLEAAHLRGRDWQAGENAGDDGIPLRVDIHRAYDQGLITLDENHQIRFLHPDLLLQYGRYLQA